MSRTVENYEQAIEYLFGRINYEQVHAERYAVRDFKLDRMAHLLSLLGDPQERIPAIHIAGTKGKGSTAAMLAEVLKAAGFRVGLFTSPHIEAFEERMRVDGEMLKPDQLVELVNQISPHITQMDRTPGKCKPTYFEIATAMAWLCFEQARTDVVVLEVGLGGRLDSTNVCRPEVCVITSISRDHTQLLGSRLEDIAREKAGIVKPNVPVVSGISASGVRDVIGEMCRTKQAPLYQVERDFTLSHQSQDTDGHSASVEQQRPVYGTVDVQSPWRQWSSIPLTLAGAHQAHNAALAVTALDVLRERGWSVPTESVVRGMRSVTCPLRIEFLARKPTVVVDAAHNSASIAALTSTLARSFSARRRILIFATARDKDAAGHLRQLLPRFDTVILTQYLGNPRALPAAELHQLCRSLSTVPVHLAANPAQAWKLARWVAGEDDLICVTGSFFIAAEARALILDDLQRTSLTAGPHPPVQPVEQHEKSAPQTLPIAESESSGDRDVPLLSPKSVQHAVLRHGDPASE